MIMGPNGTGKSTVVCAMCLGLNGNTNLLGRAKEVSLALLYVNFYSPRFRGKVCSTCMFLCVCVGGGGGGEKGDH